MTSIDELNLAPDALGEIDYNAPEPGAFPPSIQPGTFDFQFKLEEDPYSTVKIQGKDYLQVAFIAVPAEGQPLRFQRASFYKHEKMPNSMAADLIRSLGVRIAGPLSKDTIDNAFKDAEATGKHFRGEVAWRSYCKACDKTVSTHPRKKKGDMAWPRDVEHNPVMLATCPGCGSKNYGRADIVRFKLPESEQSTTVAV